MPDGRGGARSGSGRKIIDIDLLELEKLCSIGCTDKELAAFFGVSTRTIEKRRKHSEFLEAMERGQAKGCISLRRCQMKSAEKGNAAMLIWLGKQRLGQRDVVKYPVCYLFGHVSRPVHLSPRR